MGNTVGEDGQILGLRMCRVSPRRLKGEAHSKEPPAGGSPRHGSCTDPDWSPSSVREDASSGTPPPRASGGSLPQWVAAVLAHSAAGQYTGCTYIRAVVDWDSLAIIECFWNPRFGKDVFS